MAQAPLEFGTVDTFEQESLGGTVDPGDIGEVQPIGRIFRTEGTVSQRADGAGALRPASQPEIFVGIEGQRGTGMIHQIAPDVIGAVGNAVGETLAGRHQQQTRGLDTVGRHHEGLAANPVAIAFRVVKMCGNDAILLIMLQLVDHRIVDQADASSLRCCGRNTAVVLRIHRADRLAVVAAATGRTLVKGATVSSRCAWASCGSWPAVAPALPWARPRA